MKIDEIEPEKLKQASKLELQSLHLRLHQLYANFLNKHPGQENEQLINAHIFVVGEMVDRGIKHNIVSVIDRESKQLQKLSEEYAPVVSDEIGLHEEKITIEQIQKYFKPFIIGKNLISGVGGVVCGKDGGNDIDILVKIPTEERLFDIITFRLYRMFPIELRKRLHFVKADSAGPFTNHCNMADLVAVMYAAPEVIKMAEKDRIVPGRFFIPMKPTKAHAPNERQTVGKFLEMFKPEDFPVYSSIKKDGVRATLHKSGKKVWIYTEEGTNITDKLPSITEAVSGLPYDNIVLDCELELLVKHDSKGIHYPREVMASKLLLKEPDDKNIYAQCFAILYINGEDYHMQPYEKIYELMEKESPSIPIVEANIIRSKIQSIRHIIDRTVEELGITTKQISQIPYSEGNVAKMAKSVYNLSGKRSGWVKYRNNAVANAKIIRVIPTKTPDIANLELGLLIKDEITSMGRSFNIRTPDYKLNEIVLVEYETLNHVTTDGKKSYGLWAPRVIGKSSKTKPDEIGKTISLAKKNRVYQKKTIVNGETTFDI